MFPTFRSLARLCAFLTLLVLLGLAATAGVRAEHGTSSPDGGSRTPGAAPLGRPAQSAYLTNLETNEACADRNNVWVGHLTDINNDGTDDGVPVYFPPQTPVSVQPNDAVTVRFQMYPSNATATVYYRVTKQSAYQGGGSFTGVAASSQGTLTSTNNVYMTAQIPAASSLITGYDGSYTTQYTFVEDLYTQDEDGNAVATQQSITVSGSTLYSTGLSSLSLPRWSARVLRFTGAATSSSASFAPNANAKVTLSAGDNNGYNSYPTRAYGDDSSYASDTNSGTASSSVTCPTTYNSSTLSKQDQHNFYYSLSTLPDSATLTGIQVKLDAWKRKTKSSLDGTICIYLSGDGGSTWANVQTQALSTSSTSSYTLPSTSDSLWGYMWNVSTIKQSKKFVVRLVDVTNSSSSTKGQTFRLDYIGVTFFYTGGSALDRCATTKPAAPTLVLPAANGKVNTRAVSLDWEDASCATRYNVVVRLDSKKGDAVVKDKANASQFLTKALEAGKTYYWQIKACNAVGCTASPWWNFQVNKKAK
ncbi:MAG: hypothetical protein HY741_22525 [Chloroflexi bacterium]|nr:hypothetical protein [Chloroflexota bacterium]